MTPRLAFCRNLTVAVVGASVFCLFSVEARPASSSNSGHPQAEPSALSRGVIEILYVPANGYAFAHAAYPRQKRWFSLSCGAAGCQLKTVLVRARRTKVRAYADDDQPAQSLTIDGGGLPLLLLDGLKGVEEGAVPTLYHAGMGPPSRPNSGSEFEVEIQARQSDTYRIIPRFKPESGSELKEIRYYLHHDRQKQLLRTISIDPIVGSAGLPRGTDLLLWAGDLDGDGRTDFLLSIDSRTGESLCRILYLSSLAKKGELVGVAAEFYYWPPDNPGC